MNLSEVEDFMSGNTIDRGDEIYTKFMDLNKWARQQALAEATPTDRKILERRFQVADELAKESPLKMRPE